MRDGFIRMKGSPTVPRTNGCWSFANPIASVNPVLATTSLTQLMNFMATREEEEVEVEGGGAKSLILKTLPKLPMPKRAEGSSGPASVNLGEET